MKMLLSAIISILILGGCSTIKITDCHGAISYEREFGFVSLNAHSSVEAIVADVSSFGYMDTPMGISIGYSKQSIAFLPENCKIVLWVKNHEQLLELQELVGDIESVCPVIVDE